MNQWIWVYLYIPYFGINPYGDLTKHFWTEISPTNSGSERRVKQQQKWFRHDFDFQNGKCILSVISPAITIILNKHHFRQKLHFRLRLVSAPRTFSDSSEVRESYWGGHGSISGLETKQNFDAQIGPICGPYSVGHFTCCIFFVKHPMCHGDVPGWKQKSSTALGRSGGAGAAKRALSLSRNDGEL